MVYVVIVFGLMAVSEAPGLIRRRLWGELAVFTFFWLLGLAMVLVLAAGGQIPNPNRAIEAAVEGAGKLFRGLFR
jgi:NADH:ubiquinone oxidoreductase subunit 6 (subunit J)